MVKKERFDWVCKMTLEMSQDQLGKLFGQCCFAYDLMHGFREEDYFYKRLSEALYNRHLLYVRREK